MRFITLLLSSVIYCFLPVVESSTEESDIVFIGRPKIRTAMNGQLNPGHETLSGNKGEEFLCVITKENGRYFWKSRDGYEVRVKIHGSFIDFQRLDRLLT